jgi:hypothetical protein
MRSGDRRLLARHAASDSVKIKSGVLRGLDCAPDSLAYE